MGKLVNAETNKSVAKFIESVADASRKEDSQSLLPIIEKITGKKPKIWGKNIVGFGKYKYKRRNGEEYEWFNVGFSPGKTNLTIYVMYDISKEKELLEKFSINDVVVHIEPTSF